MAATPGTRPPHDPPIDANADLPSEAVNPADNDEESQSQTVAANASSRGADDFGLDDSEKVSAGEPDDDVKDLVDRMRDMVSSGRIDLDAYRGERNDDDEDGMLGPDGDED